MAITRTYIPTGGGRWLFYQDTIVGSLTAVDIDAGDTIPAGLYLAAYNVRINANIASSTLTVLSVGGVNLIAADDGNVSLLGSVAVGTQLWGAGLIHLSAAGPQVATTAVTANPEYDLTITIQWVGDYQAT